MEQRAMATLYDVKCKDLAYEFLADSTVAQDNVNQRADELAQAIQDAIDDYLREAEHEYADRVKE